MFRGRKEEQEFTEEENKSNPLRELAGMLVYIIIVLAVTFLFITFVGQRTHVSGESMENTLDDGDQLIVDKITYRFKDPERFDIIVFPFHYKGKYLLYQADYRPSGRNRTDCGRIDLYRW